MLFLDEVSAISGGAAAFAKEAMKEINVFLEEYPGRFIFFSLSQLQLQQQSQD